MAQQCSLDQVRQVDGDDLWKRRSRGRLFSAVCRRGFGKDFGDGARGRRARAAAARSFTFTFTFIHITATLKTITPSSRHSFTSPVILHACPNRLGGRSAAIHGLTTPAAFGTTMAEHARGYDTSRASAISALGHVPQRRSEQRSARGPAPTRPDCTPAAPPLSARTASHGQPEQDRKRAA